MSTVPGLRVLYRHPAGPVAVRFVESTRTDTPESAASIAHQWQQAQDRGLLLFDGPMCRLEAATTSSGGIAIPPSGNPGNPGGLGDLAHVERDALTLHLSRTTYRTFLGTNLLGPRSLPRHTLANPLGVSPALVSGDGKLLLGRRNASVAYYPHRLHPFSGSLEPSHLAAGQTPAEEVRRELAEELHLAASEVPEVRLLGLVEDVDIRHPELIFLARTPLASAEVLDRLDPEEHAGAEAIDATPVAIDARLGDAALTPVACAALALYADDVERT